MLRALLKTARPAFGDLPRTEGQPAAHLVARAASPSVAAVEPNTPLMTETGETPHTVADHPADAIHLPLRSAPLTPCHPPLPRCRARNQSLPATLPNTAVTANRRRTVRVSTLWHSVRRPGFETPQRGAADATGPPDHPLPHTSAHCKALRARPRLQLRVELPRAVHSCTFEPLASAASRSFRARSGTFP
ncbi:hypothetical protein SY2F82_38190 [Streptomyces sp. Y2F8-2]|nr:hypothetical protein SY2F82_38190 [Streptomyces sp. Y2F8-2]